MKLPKKKSLILLLSVLTLSLILLLLRLVFNNETKTNREPTESENFSSLVEDLDYPKDCEALTESILVGKWEYHIVESDGIPTSIDLLPDKRFKIVNWLENADSYEGRWEFIPGNKTIRLIFTDGISKEIKDKIGLSHNASGPVSWVIEYNLQEKWVEFEVGYFNPTYDSCLKNMYYINIFDIFLYRSETS